MRGGASAFLPVPVDGDSDPAFRYDGEKAKDERGAAMPIDARKVFAESEETRPEGVGENLSVVIAVPVDDEVSAVWFTYRLERHEGRAGTASVMDIYAEAEGAPRRRVGGGFDCDVEVRLGDTHGLSEDLYLDRLQRIFDAYDERRMSDLVWATVPAFLVPVYERVAKEVSTQ